MNNNREISTVASNEIQKKVADQLLEEIRSLFKEIDDKTSKNSKESEFIRAIATDTTSHNELYESEEDGIGGIWEQFQNEINSVYAQGFFNEDQYKQLLDKLALEEWNRQKHNMIFKEKARFLEDDIQNMSTHAQLRMRQWIQRNQALISEWNLMQILGFKEYPNPDRETGIIKIFYFNIGDKSGDIIDLTY